MRSTVNYTVLTDCNRNLGRLIADENNEQLLQKVADLFATAFKNRQKIYLTGIGKPGYVAEKQAATLKSIRIDAQFIDATLAGHGDLGPIPEEPSLLIALSKSGCSTELYKLFAAVKRLRPNCKTAMICFSNDEQLAIVKACPDIDVIVRFPLEFSELDGYGIVPTTSNILFEAILSTGITSAVNVTFGYIEMCERLRDSHPSGTLHDKVVNLLSDCNFVKEHSKH